MKIFFIIGLLVIIIILCDTYESRLPPPLNWIYAGWKKFSHVLGFIMSKIILTILWIVGIGTYGIILKIISIPKLFNKKPPKTFWIDGEPTTVDSYKHQF